MLKFQVILLTLALSRPIAAEKVKCAEVEMVNMDHFGVLKTCSSNETTSITTNETEIDEPKDETMEFLEFSWNSDIKFLPIEVHKIFPNLCVMDAIRCSLTTISKKNFEKLDKLKILSLSSNQIEKIPTNTFEDLKSLELLYLSYNKIKFLNGQVFDGLTKLRTLWLAHNVCIDKNVSFFIAALKKEIDEKCGFQDQEALN